LAPPGPHAFAGGFPAAFHQACVRGKLLHGLEARHVVDPVEDRQGENLAHAADRAQSVEHVGVIKAFSDAFPVGLVGQLRAEVVVIALVMGVLDVCQEPAAMAHQV
jgi:hypothetical protein